MRVLLLLAMALSGLAAGASFNMVLAMIPALRSLDAAVAIEVRRVASRLPAQAMVAFAAGAGLAGAAVLVLYRGLGSDVRALVGVAVGLSALVTLAGLLAMRPELALQSSARELPSERYLALSRRWELAQVVMAPVSLAAAACYATGAASAF